MTASGRIRPTAAFTATESKRVGDERLRANFLQPCGIGRARKCEYLMLVRF